MQEAVNAGPVILVVEDNEDDARLIERAIHNSNVANPLHFAATGEKALEYLSGDRTLCPIPELILLDLKLPGIDGFQVLEWVRQQKTLAGVRIVILTSSTNVRDANQAFALGADAFLIKPADFLRLAGFAEAMGGCWMWASRPQGGVANVVGCA